MTAALRSRSVHRRLAGSGRASSQEALGYVKPGSYEELRAVLSSGTVRLPKRLQIVSDFLWRNPGDVALGTVSTVAAAAGVQPSSLVRFAQALGYEGFTDLQEVFKAYAKATWVEGKLWNGPAGNATDEEKILEGMITASATSLTNLRERPQIQTLAQIARTLAGSEMIYLVGNKRAHAVASYAALALLKLGVRSLLIDNVGGTAFEQLGCASSRDAVLAISFAPYNSATPNLATFAAQRGARVVSITDSPKSPLTPVSEFCLQVAEGEFGGFKSVAGAVAMAMTVALAVAKLKEVG